MTHQAMPLWFSLFAVFLNSNNRTLTVLHQMFFHGKNCFDSTFCIKKLLNAPVQINTKSRISYYLFKYLLQSRIYRLSRL